MIYKVDGVLTCCSICIGACALLGSIACLYVGAQQTGLSHLWQQEHLTASKYDMQS